MSPWTNFLIVICLQFLIFLLIAYKHQGFRKITLRFLVQSITLGIIAGTIFDLLIGKYFGIFDYALHFSPAFLILNGAFSYGIWILTVGMLQSERLLPFCAWTILIGLGYELANYFFRVWYWTFGGSFLSQEAVVILVAYCGLALLTAFWMSVIMKVKYRLFR